MRCCSAPSCLWALNIVVTKYMFEHGWLPLAYATIRYFVAISIFWGYTWWRERSFRIARADWIYVGIAASMIFLNQLCFVYSLEFAHAADGVAALRLLPDVRGADLDRPVARRPPRARSGSVPA